MTSLIFIFLVGHVHFYRNTFVQIVSNYFIYRLSTSNINTRNYQVISFCISLFSNFTGFFVNTEYSLLNDFIRFFLELFKVYSRNHTSNFRGYISTSITYEIVNRKYLFFGVLNFLCQYQSASYIWRLMKVKHDLGFQL